jgi:hypothetical protein
VSNPSSLAAARWYGAHVGPVLPLHHPVGGRCSCSKSDCQSPAKHPRWAPDFQHGLGEATRIPEVISELFTRWPSANVALVTGKISGTLVLDIDPRHGGDESLDALEEQHGKLPHTPEVLTGGGGRHLYFAAPERPVPSSTGVVGPGLDVRAEGGYVVAPPSVHITGKPYAWELSSRIGDVPLAQAPEWLLELCLQGEPTAKGGIKPAKSEDEWLELLWQGAAEGKRNVSLSKLAGHLLRIRVLRPSIAAALVHCWNEARCQPPLGKDEVQQVINSIAKRELHKRTRTSHVGGRHG